MTSLSISFEIGPQPDDTTCGPTCLHAVYRHYGRQIGLERVIAEVGALDRGGTLAALLGCHALDQGFRAELYSFNLRVFDPTWFTLDSTALREKLLAQSHLASKSRLQTACRAYLDFLEHGGRLRFAELSSPLIRQLLSRGPVLTGLSATWLYRTARERPHDNESDDLHGEPVGHFVVLCGYDEAARRIQVADPMRDNPLSPGHVYPVAVDRLRTAILLGVLTFDANLLLLELPVGGPAASEPGQAAP